MTLTIILQWSPTKMTVWLSTLAPILSSRITSAQAATVYPLVRSTSQTSCHYVNLYCKTGSIATGKSVSGVTISGNTVTNSQNGLRIKIDADATDASVSDVTYSGNTISGISKYGVLITEVRPLPLHTSVQFW
jgi:hypothetical protein